MNREHKVACANHFVELSQKLIDSRPTFYKGSNISVCDKATNVYIREMGLLKKIIQLDHCVRENDSDNNYIFELYVSDVSSSTLIFKSNNYDEVMAKLDNYFYEYGITPSGSDIIYD